MPKPPRKPRAIQRGADLPSNYISSQPLVGRKNKRQADLFAPGFVEPCKPTLSDRVPVGELWQYEIKHDGDRAQCHVHAGHVRIFTRRGLDWSDRMPAVRAAL
jgi:bifunctional non-homologous end joining protein LigD